ncbi:acyl-CoA carboxylase subunit epsilon, partial [Streptomyces sp. SR27]
MSTPANLLRVEKGHADPEELAAITAVLLARAAAQPVVESAGDHR